MSLFNLFKKKQPNPEVLFKKMFPDGNGKKIIYESYKKVSDKMTTKLSEEEALAFYLLCSMKFELLKKTDKTINKIIQLIQEEKPNIFTHMEADKIARQIYVDAMARFYGTGFKII